MDFSFGLFGYQDNGALSETNLATVKIWIIAMFLIELFLAFYLHYRQWSHMKSVTEVPWIIQRFDDGLYHRQELKRSRRYTTEVMVEHVLQKLYYTLLWIAVIFFDWISLSWKLGKDLTSHIWPQFINPVIGRNVAFAMISYASMIFLLIPLSFGYILKTNGGYTPGHIFLQFFINLVENVIPVGVSAGLATCALMTFDSLSVLSQTVILGVFLTIFVITYPSLEIWLFINDRDNILNSFHTTRSRSSLILELRLHALCDRVGFPRDNLILYPSGSVQTSAFYCGFLWCRRIVVFLGDVYHEDEEEDLLSLTLTPKEIESVVAHELGHWYFSHGDQSILIWHTMKISTALLIYWLRSNKTILHVFACHHYGSTDNLPVDRSIEPNVLPQSSISCPETQTDISSV